MNHPFPVSLGIQQNDPLRLGVCGFKPQIAVEKVTTHDDRSALDVFCQMGALPFFLITKVISGNPILLGGPVPRRRDEAAYQQAMKQWVIPECLHVPIVAENESAITDHVGDIVQVLSPGRALVVAIDPPPERDQRLPIWTCPGADVLFEPIQVWVSPGYGRYRQAYVRAKGPESVQGKVLGHVYNRRMALLRDYGFVRLVPVSRSANSSSGFSEQWGVDLAGKDLGARRRERGLRIQYADLSDLLLMLDMSLGGGTQNLFREGQKLIEVLKGGNSGWSR